MAREIERLRRQHMELKAVAARELAQANDPECDPVTRGVRAAEAQMTRDQVDALARRLRVAEERELRMAAPTLAGVTL